MTATRVGLVTQWFPPERGSAAHPGVVAGALRRQGLAVRVLTGLPNYPTGELYPGYRIRPYQTERIDGLPVTRVPLYPSHDATAVRRIANFATFATAASVAAPVALRGADVALVYWSPATAALPARLLHALSGTPYVLFVQDMWPQSVTESGFLDGPARRVAAAVLNRYCDAIYRRADRIAVTSPGMADLIHRRGVPRDKLVFVPNWADEAIFRPTAKDPVLAAAYGLQDRRVVMYAGNLGDYQGLEVLLHAADLLRARDDLRFVLIGGGLAEQSLRAMASDLDLPNVVFLGQRALPDMPRHLALADVQVASLRDIPIFRSTLPSKIQATLASGQPIIAALAGDAAVIVEQSGAGAVVRPGDAPALAEAVVALVDDEDRRATAARAARAFYESTFSERRVSARLAQVLQEAAR